MTSPSECPSKSSTGWASEGILRSPGEVETARLGPNQVAFPLRGEETGGKSLLTEFTVAPPPAPGPPPHIHEDSDEAVYVLDGTLEMGIGEQTLTGSAGSVMLVRRGMLHSLGNPGPGPVRMLIILSPPGYEGFCGEMAEIEVRLGTWPDPETVLALQRKYHLNTGGETRRFD